jgi:hypothetical protein
MTIEADVTPYLTLVGLTTAITSIMFLLMIFYVLKTIFYNARQSSNLSLEREKARTLYTVTIYGFKTGIVKKAAAEKEVEICTVTNKSIAETAEEEVANDMATSTD